MIRKIIQIDETLCNGCALCVKACHEGAIGMVNGKATLLRDDYCDGLGDCLPICPTGAISFQEREAAAYDEQAVKQNMAKQAQNEEKLPCGCPGSMAKTVKPRQVQAHTTAEHPPQTQQVSQLTQWPVQIKLVPVNAPYFDGAHLLIAADCTAYAYAGIHQDYIKGRITLIGCPKLDDGPWAEKLADIIRENNIKSVTILRMEVPCCAGIASAAVNALRDSGKMIPWQTVVIGTDGTIIPD